MSGTALNVVLHLHTISIKFFALKMCHLSAYAVHYSFFKGHRIFGYKVKAFSNSLKMKGQTYARVKATASSSLFERWQETGDVRSAFSRNREALAIKCGWKKQNIEFRKLLQKIGAFPSMIHTFDLVNCMTLYWIFNIKDSSLKS